MIKEMLVIRQEEFGGMIILLSLLGVSFAFVLSLPNLWIKLISIGIHITLWILFLNLYAKIKEHNEQIKHLDISYK